MFQNYIQVALRNLVKNKLYSAINILGLAVGLAACILITLFVRDELSYDKFWADSDRIHRIHTTFNIPGRAPFVTVVSAGPARETAKNYFSNEIEYAARINNLNPDVIRGDQVFNENVFWTDPDLADIFSFDVVKGDLKKTLNDNASIALNESLAKKYFGDEDPMGQIMTIRSFGINKDYRVGAIYKDIPHNSVLNMPALVKIVEEDFQNFGFLFGSWFSVNNQTYYKLKEGVDPSQVSSRWDAFVDKSIPFDGAALGKKGAAASEFIKYSSLPLTDIQLTPSGTGELKPTGSMNTVYLFASIAGLILIIACINFMNLTTAKSTQRAREVALRKVLGANRGNLIKQFLGESVILALIGLVIGVVIVEVSLPAFNDFLSKELVFSYADPNTALTLAGLIIFVGIAGGFYPAIILSGFRPSAVLKANKSSESKGSILFRNALVVFQFAVSIALMIGASVVYAQKQYAINMDPGYNKENLYTVMGMVRQGVTEKRDAFEQEVLKMPGVKMTTFSADTPSNGNESNRSVTIPGDSSNQSILIGYQAVGYDYFKTYEIPMVAGRTYSRDQGLDELKGREGLKEGEMRKGNVIINESAVKRLGFGNPHDAIGKLVQVGIGGGAQAQLTVVGVSADTHFQSLKQVVRPEMYYLEIDNLRSFAVRYSGDGLALQMQIENKWREMFPDVPFLGRFVEEATSGEFREETRNSQILAIFSGLAVLVACLGLYGLASFAAVRRTKEIGIRKVMGARIRDIVTLLVWQFSKPVIVANLIAWPLTAYAMINWLQEFPVRLDAIWLIPLCLGAGLIAVAIAWGTVGTNVLKVARSNPIKALRYE